MVEAVMGSDKWTRTSTHRLIELFEANQCLWNLSHDEYKNKLARKRAIDEIASNLNMNAADIKLKIHRLRTQFSNERNRIRRAKTQEGQDARRSSKWDYYSHLIFLLFKNEVKTELKHDPLETTTQITNLEIYKQDEETQSDHELMEEVLSEHEQQMSSTRIEPIPDEDLTTITLLRQTPKESKYLHYEMEFEQHPPGIDTTHDIGETSGEMEKQHRDENEIFGKYIASELRQLGNCPDLWFKLKNGIQRLVWEISSEHSTRNIRIMRSNQQKNRHNSNFAEQDREEVFLLEDGED